MFHNVIASLVELSVEYAYLSFSNEIKIGSIVTATDASYENR